MEFKTTSYFFPSNRHRIKRQFRQSPLHTFHRKQISENLSSFISQHNHHYSLDQPQSKNKKKRTINHSRDSSVAKMRAQTQVSQNKQGKFNIGIFNILQKVRILKAEENSQAKNPFYKIQKARKNNKIFHHTSKNREQIPTNLSQKLNKMQSSQKNIQQNLFHNDILCDVSEEKPKVRNKSETVIYYEIKQYFQKKYCKFVPQRQVLSNIAQR